MSDSPVSNSQITARWLGRLGYAEALALQEEIVAAQLATIHSGNTDSPGELLLLEHEAVYTIGRTPDQSSLRDAARLPHPVIQINRGGQATFHGPGQLVGYPILDLSRRGRDLHRYLRTLEEIIITVCQAHGIEAIRREGLTGVWVGARKLASIGVGVRHWISMHGFALNVCGELSGFQQITPCGIAGVEMTSLERECGHALSVPGIAEEFATIFEERLNELMPLRAPQA
jgi:lipoyl(octanoyl) transferase